MAEMKGMSSSGSQRVISLGRFAKFRYFCNECNTGFTGDVRDHLRKHDGTVLKCEFCSKTFASQNGLDRHMSSHTGNYPFYCSYCNAGFHMKSRVAAHEKKHQSFTCHLCNKVFYTEYQLQQHNKKCSAIS